MPDERGRRRVALNLLAYAIGFILTALSFVLIRRFARPALSPEVTSGAAAGAAIRAVEYAMADADVGRIVAWGTGLAVGTLVPLVCVTVLFLGLVGRPLAIQLTAPCLATGPT